MSLLDVLIPKQDNVDNSTLRVFVNNTPMDDKFSVSAVVTNNSVNKIPYAQMVLIDGDVPEQDFPVSSSSTFVPGAKVRIMMGYESNEKKVFEGIIIKHTIQLQEGKPTSLIVELKDEAVKLTIGRKNKFFGNKLDSVIMEDVLGNFKGIVEPTTAMHEEMIQYFCTDWDFVLSRAEVNGMLAFVQDGKVNIKKPNLNNVPDISVVFGANAYEFEAEMDARDEYSSVQASSWDDATREVITQEGQPPAIAKEEGDPSSKTLAAVIGLKDFALQHCGQLKNDELRAWASAKLLRSHMAKIKGRAKIDGYMDIKPGDMLGIDKFSKRFNGAAFVSGVVQQISADASFYTEIQFGMPQEWFSRKYTDIDELPAAGLLPSVSGLQAGIVKAISGDPGNDYRVKVNLPMVKAGNDGVWARLANLDAGNKRGSFFYPEVGDEVILGFMNDDPREAVILGMLYSKNSNGKPPLEPTQANNKKGFYTRSKIKLEFDDEKQSVLITTPDGNMISIADKDEAKITISDKNKNKIEMSKDGITIDSAKDLNLKAKGDIKIEGNNISESAKAKYKTEGQSGIEISSSANTVIKGSVVQIN